MSGMKHVLKVTTVLSFNYFFLFFTFVLGFVHHCQFVLYFEVISFTMVKYIVLIAKRR